MREALDNLRIVDFSRAMAGPFATMILGDMGAEVVKVERPDGGDTTRQAPRTFHPDDENKYFGGYFNSINRNKKSITVDLQTDAGQAIATDLAETADVVVENYRRGIPARLGIDYDTLTAVNPELVYCSLSGYGEPTVAESPYAEKPAFDVTAQAIGGAMYITSPEPNGPPTKIGPGVGDIVPALFAANGILTALWHRERTGEGQYVDISMYDAIVALCERIIYTYSYRGEIEEPAGNARPSFAPFGIFEAKDGHVAVAAPNEHLWTRLCELMERTDLIDDPRFESAQDRAEHYPELKTELEAWFTQRTKKEIFDELSDDVPCGPVNTAEDIMTDPHLQGRDMLASVSQPLGNGKTASVEVANTPIKLSNTPGGVEQRAPELGEHNEELLSELGYSPDRIATLFENDVITPKPIKGGRNL